MNPTEPSRDDWLQSAWAQAAEEWQVEVEGATIACRSWNRHAAGRPGILLTHGFRAHARWWDHIAPCLAEGRHVLAMDFSGMGDSSWRPVYARTLFAREIVAVAVAAGMQRPIIISHSFGGVVALLAGALKPDLARRLILIDSALPPPEPSGAGYIQKTLLRVYADRDSALARYRLIPPGRWPHPAVLAYIAQNSVTATDNGWRWKFDPAIAASLNAETTSLRVSEVRLPANFIYGALSEIMTPERIALARHYLPLCREPVAIPACHHHVLIEQPLALIAVLRALIAEDRD